MFPAKTQPCFDAEIDEYLTRTGIARPLARQLEAHIHENLVKLRWEGSVPHRVEGTLDPAFVRRTFAADAPHHGAQSVVARALTKVLVPRGHRPHPVRYDDVVKPEMRTGTGELLEPRVYRVGR